MKLIDRYKLAKVALDKDFKIFIVNIATFNVPKLDIHLFQLLLLATFK